MAQKPPIPNPFAVPREAKTKIVHFRITESEHAILARIAKTETKDLVDIIYEGIGLAIDKRNREPKRKS